MIRDSKTYLYLGPELPESLLDKRGTDRIIHCPVLKFRKKREALYHARHYWEQLTHIVWTSKTAARIGIPNLPIPLPYQKICAIGPATAEVVRSFGWRVDHTGTNETAEGMCTLLFAIGVDEYSFVLWAHANKSRPVITEWLREQSIPHCCPVLYYTMIEPPEILPDLNTISHVFFSSPSTVEAFWQIFGPPPKHLTLEAIGPVTKQALLQETAKL